jgi:hypothetical protein
VAVRIAERRLNFQVNMLTVFAIALIAGRSFNCHLYQSKQVCVRALTAEMMLASVLKLVLIVGRLLLKRKTYQDLVALTVVQKTFINGRTHREPALDFLSEG